MQNQHVDALIIGFGKGGKTLAPFLAKQGLQVAVVERSAEMYGGTCINIGCIPTKSLIHSAEMALSDRHTDFSDLETKYQEALQTKDKLVSFLRQKNFDLDRHEGVQVITGNASFLSPHQVQIDVAGGESITITADKIFIGTGTTPIIPEIKGIRESTRVYTSTSLMENTQLPRRLVIIGSGYIGLEFASMYAAFGTEVIVLEWHETFLPREDRDVADEIKRVLQDKGIRFYFKASVESIQDNEDKTVVTIRLEDQRQEMLETDAVLVATGRKPNTESLRLDRAGIVVTEGGFIQVDDTLRTNVPHIWAIGDVNGGLQFTYISLDDYRIIKDQLFGEKMRTLKDRRNIPYSVFITPTFARVGLSEEEARRQGYRIKVAKLSAAASPRARMLNATEGFLKAIIDEESGYILGCVLFCVDAAEMINLVALAMDTKRHNTYLRDRIFTHPSMMEILNDLFAQID